MSVVLVSAPKSGMVVLTAQSRAGWTSIRWIASVSPGSAPSTWNGPVCGLTNGYVMVLLGRSSRVRILPPKASSVKTSSTSPGRTRMTGSQPPNVQAYWSGVGTNRVIEGLLRGSFRRSADVSDHPRQPRASRVPPWAGFGLAAPAPPQRFTSASRLSGRTTPLCSSSPHASRGTRHMTSNSLPSGSAPYSDLETPWSLAPVSAPASLRAPAAAARSSMVGTSHAR